MSYYNFEGEKNIVAEEEHFMRLALDEAKKALAINEIPIGAVVVCNGKVIGRCNRTCGNAGVYLSCPNPWG
jgi:tRNA(adenine34) deaminase